MFYTILQYKVVSEVLFWGHHEIKHVELKKQHQTKCQRGDTGYVFDFGS